MSLLDDLISYSSELSNGYNEYRDLLTASNTTQTATLPKGLIVLKAGIFRDNKNIKTIQFSSSLKRIEVNALAGCGITNLTFPKGIEQLGNYAVASCSSLTNMFLPNTFKNIGSYAFSGSYNLENITIESGFNCYGLNLSISSKFSAETIVSWFNALADRTGDMAYTLTIGTTNLNKLTNEQKAIATNKNWNLA